MNGNQLLINALILDTETLGLERVGAIHQLAIYSYSTNTVKEWFFKPNLYSVTAPVQEHTKLSSSAGDVYTATAEPTWKDTVTKYLDQTQQTAPSAFLNKSLAQFPALRDEAVETEAVRDLLAVHKVKYAPETQLQDIENFFAKGGTFSRYVGNKRGRTLWLANAAFDSKQIGTVLGAMEQQGLANGVKDGLETATASPDPYYVTGVEVNRARTTAQLTGDWRPVYKAYLDNVAKPGETVVRDIQDVIRAVHSYGKAQGRYSGPVYQGTSMDVAYRLFGSLDKEGQEAIDVLTTAETHGAAADASIHQRVVLNKALELADALKAVDDQTPLGAIYEQLAEQGKGPLHEARKYFQMAESIQPMLQEANVHKRLGRAVADLATTGQTVQKQIVGSRLMPVTQSDGTVDKIPLAKYESRRFDSLEKVKDWMVVQGHGTREQLDEVAGIFTDPDNIPVNASAADRVTRINQIIDAQSQDTVSTFFNENARDFVEYGASRSSRGLNTRTMANASTVQALKTIGGNFNGKAAGIAGLAIAAGSIFGMLNTQREAPKQNTLVGFSYQDWQQTNEFEGMATGPVAEGQRQQYTDFGSPYQGAIGSSAVFYNQELLDEREKFLRSQYGARHYDPQLGLFGVFGPFQNARRRGYDYITEGTSADGKYGSMTKKGLYEIDLAAGNWRISAEDADTVTLEKGGPIGRLKSMLGIGKKYNFRLAGIDSPEISHGGDSYHAPQPGAHTAAKRFQDMLRASSDLKLVYDPTQTTYGRMLGVVYAGDKNLNAEVIRQGAAAYLPYGKESNSMINYKMLERLEAKAAAAKSGIWAEPYHQVLRDHRQQTGEGVTYNTLTSAKKIAQNSSLMSLVSMAETAQAHGLYTPQMASEIINMSQYAHVGSDNVRPTALGVNHSHAKSYMSEMQQDLAKMIRTHGNRNLDNQFSTRGNFKGMDFTLGLDTLNTTNSIWTKSNYQAYNVYDIEKQQRANARKQRMAHSQRYATQQAFNSPINHQVG